jgi:urea transporter
MADQTYNLTQTGAEVQAIINDANGVKGAGATTSLTTDYIMLKDTSGAYHKIQKSSFTEAVRNTLASLLVNNDKGTTISQIAAIASGDFGSVTPANLASVLGALFVSKGRPTTMDFQNCQDGVYHFNSDSISAANLTGIVTGGFVFVQLSAIVGYQAVQVVFPLETNIMAFRVKWTQEVGFQSWGLIQATINQ